MDGEGIVAVVDFSGYVRPRKRRKGKYEGWARATVTITTDTRGRSDRRRLAGSRGLPSAPRLTPFKVGSIRDW